MNKELKNKLTERFNSAYGEEVKIGLRDALRKVYLDGAEHGYQYAIEKACEWLEKNMFHLHNFDEYGNVTDSFACSNDCDFVSEFVEQFRKAMEE